MALQYGVVTGSLQHCVALALNPLPGPPLQSPRTNRDAIM
jgi:hypothetical protein